MKICRNSFIKPIQFKILLGTDNRILNKLIHEIEIFKLWFNDYLPTINIHLIKYDLKIRNYINKK